MGAVFDNLRMSSHDSIWFWVLVALVWVLAGNRVLGVPWDMVPRMGDDPAAHSDVETLLRINAERHVDALRPALWALASFVLAVLGSWGFVYGADGAQGAFLLLLPLCALWGLNQYAALSYLRARPQGAALFRFLRRHRWRAQMVVVTGVVVVSLWGGVQSILHQTFR